MKVLVTLTCLLAVSFGWEHEHRAKYHGPQHVPVIHNGVPIETPEVQHAKQAHYAALAKASHENHYYHNDDNSKHYEENHYDDGQYKKYVHGGEYNHYVHHEDDGQYKHHMDNDEAHYDDGQYKHHVHNEEAHYDDGEYKQHYEGSHYDDGEYQHVDGQYFEGSHGQDYYKSQPLGYKQAQIPAYETSHVAPKIGHDGKPLDTPEVEAAKAHHFAAVHDALTRTAPHKHHRNRRSIIESYDFTPEIHADYASSFDHHLPSGFTIKQEHAQHYDAGYYAHELPKIGHDGRPLDTDEVALAKLEHAAAHERALLRNTWAKQGILPYEGLLDTPEVEHAKAAHFAAHAAAQNHHHQKYYHY